MDETRRPGTGIQTFEELIKLNRIYVDKTPYLAKMIEDVPKTWFLARPRRFGKSMTVSTFDAIFSGKWNSSKAWL
jgi:hypothetical protein